MYIPADQRMIQFKSRDRRNRGDCGTYVRHNEDGSFTVKRAKKGALTPAYTQEISEFCADFGVDFNAIGRGEAITFHDNRPRKYVASRTDSGMFGWGVVGEYSTREAAIDAASKEAPWTAHTDIGVTEYLLTNGEWVRR